MGRNFGNLSRVNIPTFSVFMGRNLLISVPRAVAKSGRSENWLSYSEAKKERNLVVLGSSSTQPDCNDF